MESTNRYSSKHALSNLTHHPRPQSAAARVHWNLKTQNKTLVLHCVRWPFEGPREDFVSKYLAFNVEGHH